MMRPSGPLRYEVRARVPAPQAEAYARYLREEHIPDLMDTGCFVEATFARLTDDARPAEATDARAGGSEEGKAAASVLFRSAYLAPDPSALARYLAEHAPRLRAHALDRFPGGLAFEREVWDVLERWTQERVRESVSE